MEKYMPSSEEIKKAEDMMTPEEKKTSEKRELEFEKGVGVENRETNLKNLQIVDLFVRPGRMGDVVCPGEFTADIKGEVDLKKIIDKLVNEIQGSLPTTPKEVRDRVKANYYMFSDHVRTTGRLTDNENKVAAFILLNETSAWDGMAWDEVIYGINIKDNKLTGKLIKHNNGIQSRDINVNPGSRLIITGIKNEILSYIYQYVYKESKYKEINKEHNYEYDLKNIGS